jgi:carbonic anhydrase
MPTSAKVQDRTTPQQVLERLDAGNARFAAGESVARNFSAEVKQTAGGQSPLAVVLACMDSRVATEIVFDLGLGDIFSIRVAGNVVSEEALGSMEFGCAVVGAKLLLVLGHTQCSAVTTTANLVAHGAAFEHAGLDHLGAITGPIREAIEKETETPEPHDGSNAAFVDRVAMLNVRRSMRVIRQSSATLRRLIDEGQILLVGALYDVATGRVAFLDSSDDPPRP